MAQNIQSHGDEIDIEKLREAYNKAKNENKQVFTLDQHEFVTDYAKYLLEYIDSQFKTP